ncbi:glycoside hydrolase domain-containing protein [Actinopolymorpha sp. NPDC004070]|uniref:glycoside hydrolase domain-containing protein n=1 Tax=Actinopolymorpha sp. NPDC004070 TaxID=3154548 RepID=UPI0033A6A7B7
MPRSPVSTSVRTPLRRHLLAVCTVLALVCGTAAVSTAAARMPLAHAAASPLPATKPAAARTAPGQRDYVSLVDPWVEADIARYFFFQSASNPFGFVKLRPDTSTNSSGGTGYRTTEHEIKGFSHIHDWQFSGVQVMPTSGASVPKTDGDTGWQSHVEHDATEVAEPGYHKVHLDRYDVDAELTVTDRVGMHRYTFGRAGQSEIIVNLGGLLGEAVMTGAHVTKVNDHEIEGYVDQHGGAYAEHDTRLYFVVAFDRAFDSMRGWADGSLARGGAPLEELAGDDMGVYVRYNQLAAGDVVQLKVALSLTGTDGARKNLRSELPGWSFDQVRNASQRHWNDMLGRIDVRGGTHQQQVKFYTDLFHVLCGRSVVSDVDGRYMDDTWNHDTVRQIPLDADGRPQFAMYNYDALWLTQWNLNSVLGLAYPEIYSSFVKSQLRMYQDGGLLPRGPVAGNDSLIMTGSPVTSFIVGAWNKGIRDFDPQLAYRAMMDAQSVGGLFDKGALEYSGWSGAGGIRSYLDRGYVPYRSGAGLNGGAGQTLEYAFQDWTLAQFARELGEKGVNVAQYAKVRASSQASDTDYAAGRAVDGRPIRSGGKNGQNVEWASAGEQHPWVELRWDQPRTLRTIVLSDRADPDVNVNAGRLTFSDGSSVDVADVPDDGEPLRVDVGGRKVSWVRFEATGGSGPSAGASVGLNDLEAWDDTDASTYLMDRSRNWRNLFDPSTGFIRPRNADGSFLADFDPLSPSDFVEANSWQATWFTSHDVMGLANLMGGETAYADRLNYAFERARPTNFIGVYGQGYVSYGNQPGLQVAHLFNYVGKPWLTQYWVRQVKDRTYGSTSTNDGYGHHDEDQGQMGALSALMAMGLFEVTGGGHADPVYDITSPVFDEITITLNQKYYKGKQFRILTHGNSADHPYIQQAKLDNRLLTSSWFRHSQLADGGTLELWLGATPDKRWGTGKLPPSESASQGKRPTYATGIAIEGPATIREPYGKVRYDAVLTPADTTWQRAHWKVTDLDGSPTDKAEIDQDGQLTVNRRDGQVLVTATNADSGPTVRATRKVTLDLDVGLLRGNAARWPGVSATASSEYSDGYRADKVRDGVIGSKDGGDWASRGERDPWVQLDWERPVRADRIVLYDRPGDDNANAGTLTFSDGSSIPVSGLPVGGGPKTVTFGQKTFTWVRFHVQGGTGLNPGMSEIEVYAVPSAPDAPRDVSAEREGSQATVSWRPPAFDGGAPITGYVVRAYRDGQVTGTVDVPETADHAVVTGLANPRSYDFTVAARNLLGTGPERGEPVLATGIGITGPPTVAQPYGSVRFAATFTPADTTRKEATWTVTEPDGSATDKATITDAGVLTVNHRDGDVLVRATAVDAGHVSDTATVTIALDPDLARSNAARWPGVTATASSRYDANYGPGRVHDGFGAGAGEWASAGEQNPWVQLQWAQPVLADRITVYDRPGVDDANGGTLSFSDGSTVPVRGLPGDGKPLAVDFAARTFTWVRFQVEAGTGPNVGLAEVEVSARPSTPTVPLDVSAAPAAGTVGTVGTEGAATVSWVPPTFDGGTPLTGYVVTPYRDGTALGPVQVEAGVESARVPGLAAGQAYEFTVAATNVVGAGPASAHTDPVVIPAAGTGVKGTATGLVGARPGTSVVSVSTDPTGRKTTARKTTARETTGRLLTFGHSYVAGLGASRPDRSWAATVAAHTCRPLTNRAVSGSLSAQTEEEILAAAPAFQPTDVVVVETGINDVRLYGPDPQRLSEYRSHLRTIVSHVRTAETGRPVPVVLVADPGIAPTAWEQYAPYDKGSQQVADEYAQAVLDVAGEFPNARAEDVRGAWSPARHIAADGVHPNDAGHALIADAMQAALDSQGLGRCLPVRRIEIGGPEVVAEPYSSTRLTASFSPERSLHKATWTVTQPDGAPTDLAAIDDDGVLTVRDHDGEVLVSATASDGSGVRATKRIRLALDVGLLRSNAARWPGVTATASSSYNDNYGPDKVRDGVVGSPDAGDWASAGEQNPWVRLSWDEPVTADRIVLHDRAGIDDVHGGTLTFDDGSAVVVHDVPVDGAAATVTFDRKTFRWVRFEVEGGSGPNVGLAEFEVYALPSPPEAPTRVSAAAGVGSATVTWSPPRFDGGAPLTGYVVTPYLDGTALAPRTVAADVTELSVRGLSAGAAYTFTVAATNLLGTGPASSPTAKVIPT